MNIDAFRKELRTRQHAASRRAREHLVDPEGADDGPLDELDAQMFSDERVAEVAQVLGRASSTAARATARSCLGILLEGRGLARLRPLDRALGRARRRGRLDEALAIAEERSRAIAAEGRAKWLDPAGRRAPGRRAGGDLLALSAEVRGESLERLVGEAERLLDGSEPLLEGTLAASRAASSAPSASGSMVPLSFAARTGALLRENGLAPAPVAGGSERGAIRELQEGLGWDPLRTVHIVPVPPDSRRRGEEPGEGPGGPLLRGSGEGGGAPASASAVAAMGDVDAPVVIEADPPAEVFVYLRPGSDQAALANALEAAGRAFAASLRSPFLSEEHRLWADRALGHALGALLSALASEHASLGPARPRARRFAWMRDVLSTRLAASLFLVRYGLLAGASSPDEAEALRRAGMRPPRCPILPIEDEPLLDSADRFRAALLCAGLRELLRTRFGNLWYREKGAGRRIREICEVGGSLVAPEIASGLSLPEASAESVLESWREDERQLAS